MPTVERYQVAFVVAVVLTLVTLPLALLFLRKGGFFDKPNERSSHTIPTPRGAGLAQMAGFAGALASTGGIPLPGFVALAGFSLLGAADDLKPRPPIVRLSLQIAIAITTVTLAINSQVSLSLPVVLSGAFAVLFLVWMVNATNFMDGINGISLVHGVIFGSVYSVILWRADLPGWVTLSVALIGVSLAVLPWNWGESARVFLGDSGSYLLGSSVALLLLATWLFGPGFIIAVAPVIIYLTDTVSTLIGRIGRRESITTAHKNHVYQRLVLAGWSHPRTAIFVAGFSTLASLTALALQQGIFSLQIGVILLLGIAATYLLSPQFAVRGIR
jgi:UDP-N-acetylmuramyl pentapeptide phosphotransferase/UDP-N-acetylglucosamine-1-phosphate transferase